MTAPTGENYTNPLDNFRSYSYHFILSATSTTEAFRAMVGGGSGNDTSSTQSPYLASVLKAKPGDAMDINGNTAYLLIDTRRFSQYSITNLNFEHVWGTGSRINPTTPISATEMTVIDTTGLSFFNLLMDLFRNKLQTQHASAFFLLSILFVGHRDDGTTETVATCHIPLILLLLGFNFSEVGAEFTIEFMETEGGAASGGPMEHINYLNNLQSVTTENRGNTLGDMCDSLEDQLNAQSLAFFQKYYTDAKGQTTGAGATQKIGKLVQYMINIPKDWRGYKLDTAAKSKNEEQVFIVDTSSGALVNVSAPVSTTQADSTPQYSQVSFSQTTQITEAIKRILESSQDFLKLQSQENREKGTAVSFKTVTNITSDDTTYLIHFDIYPYQMPKTDSATQKNQPQQNNATSTVVASGSSGTTVDSNAAQPNIITYNYLFTGKNSHIVDLKVNYSPESVIALDTNLSLGQARFANNAAAGQKVSDFEQVTSGAKISTDYAPSLRGNDPLFFPIKTIDQQTNVTKQKTEELGHANAAAAFTSKQEYTKTMAYIHFISTINLEMTVRGNPNLIKKYADRQERGGIAKHGTIVASNDIGTIGTTQPGSAQANYTQLLSSKISSAKQLYYSDYVAPRITAASSTPSGSSTDQLLNNIDVSTMPPMVKINILAPNPDYTGSGDSSSPMFTNEFFFNGVYQILFMKTIFSGGEFTHTFTLIPQPTDESTITANDSPVTPSAGKKTTLK